MPQSGILKVELFDVWRIKFMGSFPPSCNSLYVFVPVDYVSKWVEVVTTLVNDCKVVINSLRKIFSQGLTCQELF